MILEISEDMNLLLRHSVTRAIVKLQRSKQRDSKHCLRNPEMWI